LIEIKTTEKNTNHIHDGNRVKSFNASLASLISDEEGSPFTQRLTR